MVEICVFRSIGESPAGKLKQKVNNYIEYRLPDILFSDCIYIQYIYIYAYIYIYICFV